MYNIGGKKMYCKNSYIRMQPSQKDRPLSELEKMLLDAPTRIGRENVLYPTETGSICAAGCYAICPNKNGDQTALSLGGAASAYTLALGN
jgi:hypothetical protein